MSTTQYAPAPAGHATPQTTPPGRLRPRSAAARHDAADRAHLVRVIASSPAYSQWLQDKVAAVLTDEATRLAAQGHHALATALTERAAGYATGQLAAL